MQNRSMPQFIFRPVDQEGQQITIAAASARSTELTHGKKHHIFATKVCWIRIGDSTVVATDYTLGVLGSFPLSPGAVYEYMPRGSDDAFVAVIQDGDYTDDGWLYLGRAEE